MIRTKSIVAASVAAILTSVGFAAIAANAAEEPTTPCSAQLDIRSGYYRSGNAQPSATIAAGNLESVTQYRSLADGSIWPGYQKQWILDLPAGTELSYAIEFKHYGAAVGAQTVNGKTVPAPAMHIQKRPGTTFPLAYGYGQLLNGELDPLLDRALAQLKALVVAKPGLKINWQISSEFDTDHEFGTDEAGANFTWAESDARAVRAVAYLVNYLRDRGLPESVTFTVGMAGFNRSAWLRMHPPSLAWIIDGGLQYNAYNHAVPGREPYAVFNTTKAWTVADLSARWNALPIVIQEWGTPSSQGDQAEWLAKVPAALARMNSEPGPKVTRMNYFDSNDPWGTFIPRGPGEAAWVKWSQDPVMEPCQPLPTPIFPSSVPSPIPSATVPASPSVATSPSEEPSSPPEC
jgi:hypothetical protein